MLMVLFLYFLVHQEEYPLILFDKCISILFLVNVEQLWEGTRGLSTTQSFFVLGPKQIHTQRVSPLPSL